MYDPAFTRTSPEFAFEDTHYHGGLDIRRSELDKDGINLDVPKRTTQYCLQDTTHEASMATARMLQSRVLHIGPREMIWKCNSATLCECRLTESPSEPQGMLNRSIRFRKHDWQAAKYYAWDFRDNIAEKRLELSSASRVKLGETWLSIVYAYTAREMTYPEDKLPALSGMANILMNITSQNYYAGIWEFYVMESLHWLFKSPGALPTMHIAPTWSLASSTAPIQYKLLGRQRHGAYGRSCGH